MPSNDAAIVELMVKYARHEKLTEEEMVILEEFWSRSPEHQKLAEQFGNERWVNSELSKMRPAPIDEMWEDINKYLDEIGAPDDRDQPAEWKEPTPESPHRIGGWKKTLLLAASVIFCIAGVWLIYQKNRVSETTKAVARVSKSAVPEDFVAGDNEVVLTDKNGSKVDMNAEPKGTTIRWTKNAYAEKTGSNQLDLHGADQPSDKVDGMNEWSDAAEEPSDTVWKALSVGKRFAPYFLRLPDGSNVWLAGGTRFWYPEINGKDPAIYIVQGKAFFDVMKDASRTFTVRTYDGGKIEVLGTSFLVETAKDNVSVVKLLHGSVRVHSGTTGTAVLKPGQEAAFGSGRVDVRPLRDSLAALAWVHSSRTFHFDNTKFTDAVEAVASWYGYTVDNPKGLQGISITDDHKKDLTPEGVVSEIGQIEHGYLYVWVKDRVIHVSNKPPPRQ
jgi:ferric-dicitrate binding protein FerR (iron transport regulator)